MNHRKPVYGHEVNFKPSKHQHKVLADLAKGSALFKTNGRWLMSGPRTSYIVQPATITKLWRNGLIRKLETQERFVLTRDGEDYLDTGSTSPFGAIFRV